MKKRIIAILLSVSVFCFSFGLGNRPASAAVSGSIIAGVTVFSVALQLLGMMNGNFDNTANAIGSFLGGIPEGAKLTFYGDDIINPFTGEVVYHEDGLVKQGFDQVVSWVQDLFDKGELQEVDGKVKLTYDQFKEIYDKLWEIAPKPGLNFESSYSSFFLDFDGMPYEFPIGALPTASYLLNVEPGEAYAACYYNDNQIVFSDYYISLYFNSERFTTTTFSFEYLNSNFINTHIGFTSVSGSNSFTSFIENINNCFTFDSLSSASVQIRDDGNIKTHSTSNCFVFSNGVLTYTPISDVDLAGCKFGLVSTSADYSGFLKSLVGYAAIEG